MPAPYSHTPPFLSALLLVDKEGQGTIDRNALRSAGIRQVRVLVSGVEAARQLARSVSRALPEVTEVVVCHPQCADMDAATFAQLLRAHPLLIHIPLIAIVNEQNVRVEKALREQGFHAVLTRPFTGNTLLDVLHQTAEHSRSIHARLLSALRTTKAIPPLQRFEQALEQAAQAASKEAESPEAAYRQGIFLFKEGRMEQALAFFQQAAKDETWHAEAHLGMAAICRHNGEKDRYVAHLNESLEAFLNLGSWVKARSACQRLAAEQVRNPLLKALENCAAQGEHDTVRELLLVCNKLFPDADSVASLAAGCLKSPEPRACQQALATALHDDVPTIADALRECLPVPPKPVRAPSGPSWLQRLRRGKQVEGKGGVAVEETAESGFGSLPPEALESPPHFSLVDDDHEKERAEGAYSASSEKSVRTGTAGKSPVSTAVFGQGPVVAPFSEVDDHGTPSALGEGWSIIRGTTKLFFRRTKKS